MACSSGSRSRRLYRVRVNRPLTISWPSISPDALEGALALVVRDQLDPQLELPARLDEAAVLDRLGLLEDDHAVGEVLHVADQPGTGLRQRLEHQDAGHHREAGEMVRQILLGQRQVLDRDQGLTRL